MHTRHRFLAFACSLVLAACGLDFGNDSPSDTGPSGSPPSSGYGHGSGSGSGYGSTPPPPDDPYPGYPVPAEPGASSDAGVDSGTSATVDSGAPPAAPPPIDATVGAPDRDGCPADAPRVGYVMSWTGVLSRFDPDTLALTRLGQAACPTVVGGAYSPTAMAASRSGMLYVLYTSWNHSSGTGSVFAVDPVSLQCTLTPWTPLDLDFDGDVGIAVQRSGGVEGLLVLGTAYDRSAAAYVPTLARADFGAGALSVIARTPAADYAPGDLQADGYNRLFRVSPGSVSRLDPATGAVLGLDAIPGLPATANLTSMVVNQDVYAFDVHEVDTTVYRYNLQSKTTTAVSQLPVTMGAATASPCSP